MANSRGGGLPRLLSLLTPAFGLFLIGVVALANSGAASDELLRVVRAFPGGDKGVHFLLAGTMAFLLNASWRGAHWRLGPVPIQRGSLLIAVLAALEELSQRYVPSRSFDLGDLLYDLVGIVVLGELGAWLGRRSGRSGQSSGVGGARGDAR